MGPPVTPPTIGHSKVQVPKYGMTPFGRQVCVVENKTGGFCMEDAEKQKQGR